MTQYERALLVAVAAAVLDIVKSKSSESPEPVDWDSHRASLEEALVVMLAQEGGH